MSLRILYGAAFAYIMDAPVRTYILRSRSKLGIVLHTAACFTTRCIMGVSMYVRTGQCMALLQCVTYAFVSFTAVGAVQVGLPYRHGIRKARKPGAPDPCCGRLANREAAPEDMPPRGTAPSPGIRIADRTGRPEGL